MWVEENRAQRFLRRCICIMFCLMFSLFLFNFLFREHIPVRDELLWAAAFLLLTGAAGWLARRFRYFVSRYFILLVMSVAVIYFIVALLLAARLRFEPSYDLECRFVKHLVQREIQRKQQVFLSERARQEGA